MESDIRVLSHLPPSPWLLLISSLITKFVLISFLPLLPWHSKSHFSLPNKYLGVLKALSGWSDHFLSYLRLYVWSAFHQSPADVWPLKVAAATIVSYVPSVPPRSSTDEVNEQVWILKINKAEKKCLVLFQGVGVGGWGIWCWHLQITWNIKRKIMLRRILGT